VVGLTPWPLYPRGKILGTDWIGGWVDPRAGLDIMEERRLMHTEFWLRKSEGKIPLADLAFGGRIRLEWILEK
jgi:hypothetical protein